MARYLLHFDIKEARGTQTYVVEDVDSPEQALAQHNAGQSDFVAEDFEIMDLNDDPDIILDG